MLHWGESGFQTQCGRYLIVPSVENALWWTVRHWCARTCRTLELASRWTVADARAVAQAHLLGSSDAPAATTAPPEALEPASRAR